MKNIIFDNKGNKRHYFPFFIDKLFCAALSYLNAHSTLNFSRTFVLLKIITNQTSKEKYLNITGSWYK